MENNIKLQWDQTFDATLGIEVTEVGDGELKARIPVKDRLKQPFGVIHGGVYASLAESVASLGTFNIVKNERKIALGASNFTNFIRTITEGSINAVGRAVQRGRTLWIWDVEMSDDAGRICAVSRVTIIVREPRE